jgi:hypothetical protein
VARLTTYLDLESLKIQRSGFNFKSNLTSGIGDLANCDILASFVSRLNAMAYDTILPNHGGKNRKYQVQDQEHNSHAIF